jgi:hypothetical protein
MNCTIRPDCSGERPVVHQVSEEVASETTGLALRAVLIRHRPVLRADDLVVRPPPLHARNLERRAPILRIMKPYCW